MSTIRFGLIGLGMMGQHHLKYLREGKIAGAELTALCDINAQAMAKFPDYKAFSDPQALIRSGAVDALLIATPHFHHTPVTVDALKSGLHVLVEKPIAVHKKDAEIMLEAYAIRPNPKQVFGAMFQQRTQPKFKKMREMIQQGDLGSIRRVNWIITDWFRTDIYYASGDWRATWKGEGGGVLLNQCPHNLDILQWLVGMPSKVHAFCRFGQWHNIEVEDDVTAYLEFANGATGTFITTTGEAPGTNRLEIVGTQGKLICEGSEPLRFHRNEVSAEQYLRTSPERFGKPPVWECTIPVTGQSGGHAEITQNFVDHILHGKPLLAPGTEGIHSVELANAMLQSTFEQRAIALPMNASDYATRLQRLMDGDRSFTPGAKSR